MPTPETSPLESGKIPNDDPLAVKAATAEAVDSQLPGRENGPADAYRHILWTGELTRQYGEPAARTIAAANEIVSPSSGTAMDEHNNEIGFQIGREAKTWDEVKQAARDVIDNSDRSGDGRDAGAQWMPESAWRKNPVDAEGRELPTEQTNWPNTDWINGTVPQGHHNPNGGTESRYPFHDSDRTYPPLSEAEGFAADDPMRRSIETWSEADVQAVMRRPAYWQSGRSDSHEVRERVTAWFEHFYGTGPVPRDDTGRQRRAGPIRPIPTGGPVQVRAHLRAGYEVRAHSRDSPG